MARKAALKLAGKVALKAIPGVNMVSTAYDLSKLGLKAWRNRKQIASWAKRNASSLKNRLSDSGESGLA